MNDRVYSQLHMNKSKSASGSGRCGEGVANWVMPRMPLRRPGFVWTSGGRQGGRKGEGERGGGEFLWRAKSSEREGEEKVHFLIKLV